ncbi:autotransporter outer membrane beta-barrel domain-containing protein [Escherichia albertii]
MNTIYRVIWNHTLGVYQNWYLTSQWHEQTSPGTDVSKPPTVDPQRPAMLRPEAGSYISNLAAANTLLLSTDVFI